MNNKADGTDKNEIILTDEDTRNEELYENGSLYPCEMPELVDIREDYMSVFEWLRKLEESELILDPEFQRKLVWKTDQKSGFIESILLNIPLPPFYVNQNMRGRYIIIDGLQRTDTLQGFTRKDGFRLQNLQVLRKLNGLGFEALGDRLQTQIEDKQLLLYVIKPSVPIAMVYDIFNRINTGGTPLNRQEIRNCLFIGKATRLLKDLSEKDCFRRATDNGISPKRMKDREAVLRYLAFRLSDDHEKDYKNDMDEFLGNALKKINTMGDSEISDLEQDFERVMTLTYDFFGNGNFRIKSRINVALLESVSFFFSVRSDAFLRKNEMTIKENYEKLLKNPEFIDAVTVSTWDKKRVVSRFKLVQEILGDV